MNKNIEKLIKLVQENPDLEVLPFVDGCLLQENDNVEDCEEYECKIDKERLHLDNKLV